MTFGLHACPLLNYPAELQSHDGNNTCLQGLPAMLNNAILINADEQCFDLVYSRPQAFLKQINENATL